MSALPGVAQASHIPTVYEHEMRWTKQAACKGMDPEAFFPGRGSRVSLEVRATCAGCPVKADCLEHAVTHHEWAGYWGGTSEHERRELWRQLRALRRGVGA